MIEDNERQAGEYQVLSGEFKSAGDKGTFGARKGKRALSNEEVRRFRQQYRAGEITNREIRAITGLGAETVARMLRGETYTNVIDAPDKDIPQAELTASFERLMEAQRVKDSGELPDERAELIGRIEGIRRPEVQERLKGIIGERLMPKPLGAAVPEDEAKAMLGELTAAPEEVTGNPLDE